MRALKKLFEWTLALIVIFFAFAIVPDLTRSWLSGYKETQLSIPPDIAPYFTKITARQTSPHAANLVFYASPRLVSMYALNTSDMHSDLERRGCAGFTAGDAIANLDMTDLSVYAPDGTRLDWVRVTREECSK